VTRKILHMYSWDLSFNRFLRTEHCKHEKTQALTQRNINTQQFEKVPSVIWEMKKNGLSLDKYSYNYWMKSYAALSDMDKVEEVLNEIESDDKVDWNIYSTLTNGFMDLTMGCLMCRDWLKGLCGCIFSLVLLP
jgi:pentatricopeptide repeat protein